MLNPTTLWHGIRNLTAAALSVFLLAGIARAEPWILDASHTRVGFEISHLVVATVKGQFNKFSGTFDFNPESGELEDVDIVVQVASIDTNEADRDKHLRSADFFDVEQYPQLTFKSKKIKHKGERYVVEGTLTMHGVSKEVTLQVDFKGIVEDPWGNKIGVFSATTENPVLRKDYGLDWNKSLDKGGVLIGDQVKVVIEGQAKPAKK